MTFKHSSGLSRRRFVLGASGALMLAGLPLSSRSLARVTPGGLTELAGNQFDLSIGYSSVNFTGKQRLATVVNGGVPGPTLRWKEGETVTLRVKNTLAEDSSIHWHGIILPANMDGVPGISFPGIRPGETFEYKFKLEQSGTYWYHSHSGFQEQTGLYGAIIVDPAGPDPVAYDREYVVMLSDWTDEDPASVYANLKKESHYYNADPRTAQHLWEDIRRKGVVNTWKERLMWNQMRMSDRDIADVTGLTYTYLMNGVTPETGWQGLFKKGERVRLRFINGAAMSIFDVRIPGLKMTVVAADGQDVQPVSVDEFRIGVAETYDVIVTPDTEQPYCIFAQSIDRSGYTRGSLTPALGLEAPVPAMDPPLVLGHRDMGMAMTGDHAGHGAAPSSGGDHSGHGAAAAPVDHSAHGAPAMDHSGHDMSPGAMPKGMDHSAHGGQAMDHSGHAMPQTMDHSQHGGMDHSQHGGMDPSAHGMNMSAQHTTGLGPAGFGSTSPIVHPASENTFAVDMQAEAPMDGIDDPGIGLREHQQRYGRRVLKYSDLVGLHPTRDRREPTREIQLHLTGNMYRYMWSINGTKHADAELLELRYGERLRITLVNDTMMTHPIHLHGMWSELETGVPGFIPRKHTVIVQPGAKVSYLVNADAIGDWAYHCHLLYHMPGMFRTVRVK